MTGDSNVDISAKNSNVSARVMFVYSATGGGHKSTADALAESLAKRAHETSLPTPQIIHADIYQLTRVLVFRQAARYYRLLCRHSGWLYNLLFDVTDNLIAKDLVAKAVMCVYGQRIEKVITEADPDVIVVLHPLFISDVLCKLRDQSGGRFSVVSFVTDLGNAHSGWTSRSLNSAIFVYSGQIEKLRAQGCLPSDGRIFIAQAPVRAAFSKRNPTEDLEQIRALGLEYPYLLYIPGLQPRRALERQVYHITSDYRDVPIVIVGSIPRKVINELKKVSAQLMHFDSLSSVQMAAVMRNAEVVTGKAGPGIMAEVASVRAEFIPTAEVGRQEEGNSLIGRLLYGTNSMPWWGEAAVKTPERNRRIPVMLTDHAVIGDAEIYKLLTEKSSEG